MNWSGDDEIDDVAVEAIGSYVADWELLGVVHSFPVFLSSLLIPKYTQASPTRSEPTSWLFVLAIVASVKLEKPTK